MHLVALRTEEIIFHSPISFAFNSNCDDAWRPKQRWNEYATIDYDGGYESSRSWCRCPRLFASPCVVSHAPTCRMLHRCNDAMQPMSRRRGNRIDWPNSCPPRWWHVAEIPDPPYWLSTPAVCPRRDERVWWVFDIRMPPESYGDLWLNSRWWNLRRNACIGPAWLWTRPGQQCRVCPAGRPHCRLPPVAGTSPLPDKEEKKEVEGERRIAKRSEVRTTVAIEAIKLTNCGVMVVQETVAHELQGNSCWCVCVCKYARARTSVYRYACVCVFWFVYTQSLPNARSINRTIGGGWAAVKQSVKEIEIIYWFFADTIKMRSDKAKKRTENERKTDRRKTEGAAAVANLPDLPTPPSPSMTIL